MKIKLLLFAAFILFVACSDQDKSETSLLQPVSQEHKANIRTYEEALTIAENAISLLNEKTTRSGLNDRKIDLNDRQIFKLDSKTRATANVNDTLIYVFNFENSEGFALVSASKATEGLLAITEYGHCNTEESSGISGFDMFVDMAKNYVANTSSTQLRDTLSSIVEEYVFTSHDYTGPYVSVRWGQTYLAGEFCPNGICGCAATAMAQVMSYFEYPTSMTIDYPNSDVTSQSFNWSDMRIHYPKHYISTCFPTNHDVHKSISRLCRQLGHVSNSNYKYDGTGTWTRTDSLKYTMQYYGFNTSGWNYYNSTYAHADIDNGKVIIMYGNHNGVGGHFWILDGYDDVDYYIYQYVHEEGSDELVLVAILGPYSTKLNHINWGWFGVNNGYFAADVFYAANVLIPDTNQNYSTNSFNSYLYTLSISN